MDKPYKPALRLPDGRVIEVPKSPEFSEFAHTGNFRGSPGSDILAFYDPTTATGALYYGHSRIWTTQQPVSREVFWLQYEVLANTTVGLASAEAVTGELMEALGANGGKVH